MDKNPAKRKAKANYNEASKDEVILYMKAHIQALVEKSEMGHPKVRLINEEIGYFGRALDFLEGKE